MPKTGWDKRPEPKKISYTLDGKPPTSVKNGKQCCLVCRRMFATEDQLNVHCDKSELHGENYKKALAAGRVQIQEEAATSPETMSSLDMLAAFEAKLGGGPAGNATKVLQHSWGAYVFK